MFTFKRLREEHLPMVLEWRTKPRVTKYMVTDIKKDLEKQKDWFRGLSDPYWVIYAGELPIGVINLCKADNSWGYYIGEDDQTALGGLVPPFFYNHVFRTLDHLNADVDDKNESVVKMHLFHGYEYKHIQRSFYKTANDFRKLERYVLTRPKWQAQAKRYGHMVAEFE